MVPHWKGRIFDMLIGWETDGKIEWLQRLPRENGSMQGGKGEVNQLLRQARGALRFSRKDLVHEKHESLCC